jgi:hypothetical protein
MKRLWIGFLLLALAIIGLRISSTKDGRDIFALSASEKEASIDHIRMAIVSEVEASDGMD